MKVTIMAVFGGETVEMTGCEFACLPRPDDAVMLAGRRVPYEQEAIVSDVLVAEHGHGTIFRVRNVIHPLGGSDPIIELWSNEDPTRAVVLEARSQDRGDSPDISDPQSRFTQARLVMCRPLVTSYRNAESKDEKKAIRSKLVSIVGERLTRSMLPAELSVVPGSVEP